MSNGVAHGDLVLFDCPRTRRPELWQFIKLVAPAGAPPAPGQTHWLSQDASDAFCLRCSRLFRFQKGSSNSVRRHMERYHGKELARLKAQAQADSAALAGMLKASKARAKGERKAVKRGAEQDEPHAAEEEEAADEPSSPASASSPAEDEAGIRSPQPQAKRQRRMASATEQRDGEEMLIRWLCATLRPLSVAQDPGFADFVAFLSSGAQVFEPPSFDAVTHRLELMVENLRFDTKQKIKKHVGRFSLSTEVWTVDGSSSKFVALVCHFLNDEFVRTSRPLDVLELSSTSTEADLRQMIAQRLRDWGLHARNISLILWSSQTVNTVEAETSTVDDSRGHTIRLFDDVLSRLSGSFLSTDLLGDEAYSLLGNEFHKLQAFIQACQGNQAARSKLEEFRDTKSSDLWVFDSSTIGSRHEVVIESWIEMSRFLVQVVAWRPAVESLAEYSRTSEGQEVLGEAFCSQKLPTTQTWLVAEVVAALIRPLQELYDVLCGRDRKRLCMTSLPFTLQCLLLVKQQLDSKELITEASNRALHQYHNGREDPTLDSPIERDTLLHLDQVRKWITDRIFGLSTSAALAELGWCSVLDPRCARKHIPDEDREAFKSVVVERALELVSSLALSSSATTSTPDPLEFDGDMIYAVGRNAPPPAQGLMHRLLYDDDDEVATSEGLSREADIEHARLCVANEMELFMSEHQTRKSRISCPLEWWRSNRERYPLLAPLARIWLGAVASTGEKLDHSLGQEVWSENLRRGAHSTTREMIFLHVVTRLEQAQVAPASTTAGPMSASWSIGASGSVDPYAV